MPPLIALKTERLLLRPWRQEDREFFSEMNTDLEVMRHLPHPLSRAQSDAMADRVEAHFAEHGWGFWAVEVEGGPRFIGLVGLAHVRFEAHFTPAVEIGWRLVRAAWGQGFATEAAIAALVFAFGELELDEVVAFTVPQNARSRAVMERIGMRHDPDGDFEHPAIAEGPLRHHVLYRAHTER